jgi:hypothetical protein
MNTEEMPTPADQAADSGGATARVPRVINSTDATRGQPLVKRVQLRQAELEAALAALPLDSLREREDLELALSALAPMLTGDLDAVPDTVARDLSRWLERNKHLAETVPATA